MPDELYDTIYSLLDRVRMRPGMWLRRKSLLELETMLYGYSTALKHHKIQEAGTGFNERFSDFLRRKFRWSLSCGWAYAIRQHTRTSQQAFDRFFDLLDTFRKETRA